MKLNRTFSELKDVVEKAELGELGEEETPQW
jgi:hypothetical protein